MRFVGARPAMWQSSGLRPSGCCTSCPQLARSWDLAATGTALPIIAHGGSRSV
jgi:hypothetical protein